MRAGIGGMSAGGGVAGTGGGVGLKPTSQQLLREQLLLFGEAARADAESVVRESVCWGNFNTLRINSFVRKRGRPHLEWASEVFKHAASACAHRGVKWGNVCCHTGRYLEKRSACVQPHTLICFVSMSTQWKTQRSSGLPIG